MRTAAALVTCALVHSGCLYFDIDVGGAPPDGAVDARVIDPDPCAPLDCPLPSTGGMMICGRVLDVEDSQPLTELETTALRVGFYDAVAFQANPGAPPLFSVSVDLCGRFISADAANTGVAVAALSAGFITVAVDDGVATGFVPTGVGLVAMAGTRAAGVHAYATRSVTDAKWSAGMSPGFAEQGVYVGIFIDTTRAPVGPYPGAPAPGVQLLVEAGSAIGAFYFRDASTLARTTVDAAATVTGANGSALFASAMLANFSGASNLPAGCAWSPKVGAAGPGTVFVQEHLLVCN